MIHTYFGVFEQLSMPMGPIYEKLLTGLSIYKHKEDKNPSPPAADELTLQHAQCGVFGNHKTVATRRLKSAVKGSHVHWLQFNIAGVAFDKASKANDTCISLTLYIESLTPLHDRLDTEL